MDWGGGGVWCCVGGTVTLFLLVLRQDYEVALFCLIASQSQRNPACSWYSGKLFTSNRGIIGMAWL